MATRLIQVLRPTGRERHADEKLSPGVTDIAGKTIGLLDNGKPNFDLFLDRVKARLLSECGVVDIVVRRKGNVAQSAGSLLDELAQKCDLALTGSCDWGGCTSWSVHDAIELEKRGVRTVAVVTDRFEVLARLVAQGLGRPAMRMAVIPHPLGAISKEEVRLKADGVLKDIIREWGR